jgi:hypothetical protein
MLPLKANQSDRGPSNLPRGAARHCPVCDAPIDEYGNCTTMGCYTNRDTCRPPASRVRVRALSALIIPFETCKREPAPLRAFVGRRLARAIAL